jgi:fructose-specific phosphotransferase system component IIB
MNDVKVGEVRTVAKTACTTGLGIANMAAKILKVYKYAVDVSVEGMGEYTLLREEVK